jgi:hypothetical protein
LVFVSVSVVVAPFGFLEVQVKGVLREALEFRQADLGQPPEALDAACVNGALGELVQGRILRMGMIDAEVAVAEVDQAVVAAPAEGRMLRIGVDDGAGVHPAADDALQG